MQMQAEKITANWLTKKSYPFALELVALCTLLLALGSFLFLRDVWQAAAWMPASYQGVVVEKEFWRPWTALFAHRDLGHLLSNYLFFAIFGFFLAESFGWLMFPFVALLFGGLINYLVLLTLPPTASLIGASGVVYWLGGAWLALYFLLQRHLKLRLRLLQVTGVGAVLFLPETIMPNVSYLAHFVGFLTGVLWGVAYYFWNRKKFLAAEEVAPILPDEEEETDYWSKEA